MGERTGILYGAGLSWSPDARFLAISDKASAQDPGGVFVLAIDGSGSRRLTRPPPATFATWLRAISPNGQMVAFIRVTSGGVGDIYLVPFAGGEVRRLTSVEAWLERIAWTPDGRDLVYSSGGGLTDGTLWRVSASGGTPERLPVPDSNAASPAIASRGTRLAYAHRSFDANVWRLDLGRAPFRAHSGQGRPRVDALRSRPAVFTGREANRVSFGSLRSVRDLGVRRRRRERRPVDRRSGAAIPGRRAGRPTAGTSRSTRASAAPPTSSSSIRRRAGAPSDDRNQPTMSCRAGRATVGGCISHRSGPRAGRCGRWQPTADLPCRSQGRAGSPRSNRETGGRCTTRRG